MELTCISKTSTQTVYGATMVCVCLLQIITYSVCVYESVYVRIPEQLKSFHSYPGLQVQS